MRQVVIQHHILRRLSDLQSGSDVMVRLTEAGLMRPEGSSEPESPVAEIDQLFQHTLALCDLEEEIDQSRAPKKRLYTVPVLYALLSLMSIWLLSVVWAWRLDDYGDRLSRFSCVWFVLGTVSVAVLLLLHVAH